MPPKTWTTNEVLTAADLNAALASTAWTAVTFTNSWVDFAGGFQVCQYRKVGDMVQVRGQMKSGSLSLAAFTLPSGFRAPASMYFPTDCTGGGSMGVLFTNSAGLVRLDAGATTNVSLNVIQFSVTT